MQKKLGKLNEKNYKKFYKNFKMYEKDFKEIKDLKDLVDSRGRYVYTNNLDLLTTTLLKSLRLFIMI